MIVDMSTNDVLDAFGSLRRELARHSGELLKELEIGRTQMLILYRLGKGVATMTDLADYTLSDKAAITRAIGTLEQNGWIRRRADDIDRRKVLVELTVKGRAKCKEATSARDGLAKRMSNTLDAAERVKLSSLLLKVTEKLEKLRKSGS